MNVFVFILHIFARIPGVKDQLGMLSDELLVIGGMIGDDDHTILLLQELLTPRLRFPTPLKILEAMQISL